MTTGPQETPLTSGPPRGAEESLRRSLTLWDGFTLVAGSIIGSGIFASPGVVFRHVASGGASLVVWALGGLIAYCGAVCYVELALAFPSAGGEATYLTRFYGKTTGFLFTWANSTVSRPAAFAITCIVCSKYLCRFVYGDDDGCQEDSSTAVSVLAFIVAFFVFAVNAVSARVTTWTLKASSATSIFALVVAVLVGLKHSMGMRSIGSKISFEGTSSNFRDWSPAVLAALWAYDGWNTLNYASEEIAKPEDFLRIINLAIPFITCLFVFVNASYIIVLSHDVATKSETIGVDLAVDSFGNLGATVMPLFVAISAFGAAVGNMFSGSRLVFSSARDGTLPQGLAKVDERNALPVRAVFCQTVLGCVFLLVGNFEELVGVFSCATWVFYLATVLGLMKERYAEPNLERPYKAGTLPAIVFSASAAFLIIVQVLNKPKSSLAAFGFILLGVVFHRLQTIPFVRQLCCFANREAVPDAIIEHEPTTNRYKTFV